MQLMMNGWASTILAVYTAWKIEVELQLLCSAPPHPVASLLDKLERLDGPTEWIEIALFTSSGIDLWRSSHGNLLQVIELQPAVSLSVLWWHVGSRTCA